MRIKLFLWLLMGICIVACNNQICPENENNPILKENSPDSKSYQNEMSKLVQVQPDLVLYYFEERIEKAAASYLSLTTIGPDFCGTLHVLMEAEDTYSRLLQNKSGYSGAGLRCLELEFKPSGTPVYKSMSGILD